MKSDLLSAQTISRVLAAVNSLAEEMFDFLGELVAVPTVNPPGEFYEHCADLIARRYRHLGYDVTLISADGRPEHTPDFPRVNVLGRLGSRAPTLHFNGHFDVVPAGEGWSFPPFAAQRVGNRIYGRGTADQKAGLAASLYAVEAIRRAGVALIGTVEQSATVDEESGGFAGMAHLCEAGLISKDKTNYVIITEPLGFDRICLGHRGVYWFEVVAHGRAAHGSMPSLGVNAAELMAEFVCRVERDLKPRLAERSTAMPVIPDLARHPSINLNSLHGGQLTAGLETPCVPDTCRAVFDRRFLSEEPVDDVKSEVARLVSQVNESSSGHFDLRDLMTVPPVLTSPDCSLVIALSSAIREVLGRSPELIASPGTYDQKHVARISDLRQCVAYGPGILELAHQPDEYIDLDHLLESARVMALATLKLVGARVGSGEDR